jgi:hypothetical protein
MAPGMKISKRETAEPAEEPELIEDEGPEQTTLSTYIFRQLHRGKSTSTTTTASETEGMLF